MNKLVSFIIPVYNVEKYLRICIESILVQMTEQCEIVLIDDGSTDSSGKICDEYREQYKPLIAVIHQDNRGLGSARNAGIDCAQGLYLAFIDSDDYIDERCIIKILKWISEGGSDICFMKAVKVFPNGAKQPLDDDISREQIRNRTKEEVICYLSNLSKFPGSACTKLFRREFIEKNGLRFPDSRRVSEDLGFTLAAFFEATSFDSCEFDYYFYRQMREASITNNITFRHFAGLKVFIEEACFMLTKEKRPLGVVQRDLMSFIAYEYSIMIWQFSLINYKGNEKKKAKEFLKEYKWVLQYAKGKKSLMVRRAVHVIGLDATAVLLKMVIGLRKKKNG